MKTSEDNQHSIDLGVIDTVNKNFYMDDCLKSLPSEEEAIQMAKDLPPLCHKGGFHLKQWIHMALDNLFKVNYTTFETPVKRDMAVTYLRLQNIHNTTHVSFRLGYSRVTPIKPVTIP